MALSVTSLIEQLRQDTAWQSTPTQLEEQDYQNMIRKGIKRLFIDTGRASDYDTELFIEDDEMNQVYMYDFQPDEQEYILLLAKITFFKKVQADVNNIVSYTTDALSVANADKPYANLKDTIQDLQNERRIVYYKMARYTSL